MKYTILEKLKNFIIIGSDDGFKKGLLFPHNITYKGDSISLPFAMDVLKRIEKEDYLLNEVYVLSTFGPANDFEILGCDCEPLLSMYSDNDEPLATNTIYEATILAKAGTCTILGVNGHYGYLSNIVIQEIGETINVMVVTITSNNYSFCKFREMDFNGSLQDAASDEQSQEISEFLNKEELATISDGDKTLIQKLLENVNGTTRRNINICRHQIHLSYNPDAQIDLQRFLQDNPTYFRENNFWLGSYREQNPEDIKYILYDKNDLVIEVLANSQGFFISEFSHDKNKSNAQYLLNRNSKAIAIAGYNLSFHSGQFYEQDASEKSELIYLQYDIATVLLPNLKKEIRTLKEKAGVEYLSLKEYLNYQQQQEQLLHDSNCVIVGSNVATITTSSNDTTTALFLPKEKVNASCLFSDNEDVCHVDIQFGLDKPIHGYIKESEYENGYVLNFYNTHSSLESFRKIGFELRKRTSRHLKLQKDSIDDFVFSREGFDIFDKLNHKELQEPEPDMNLSFFDDKFNNVEEGNNQPLAIRKAVNSEDIFLIQGPPGTGKTSVIVEIINQLVKNKHEKILVCSQAHSAVDNIYQRIKNSGLKIGNIDEDNTMVPDDLSEHLTYIRRNQNLMYDLSKENSNIAEIKESAKQYEYISSSKEIYTKGHDYVCEYFGQNKFSDYAKLKDIVATLHTGLSELGDEARAFNNAQFYRGLDVVMGTCIGIGLNLGLAKSGLFFDTVIIDEAGKANLSETTVPMQLGKKYILVGDNKQLPPYMDSNEIQNFMEESKANLTKTEVENAISSSLFGDFLLDTNLPEGNTILLNYQYRMNPDIGNYISDLFYGGNLHNGKGTEQQICGLDGFTNAVTFIDTTSNEWIDKRNVAFESGNSQEGLYNLKEIEIFENRLLPRLLRLCTDNPSTTVGIITPYRKQRLLLIKKLKGTPLEKSVYTIDSIQGGEFDIVILSLVRSFNTNPDNRTVGFLDDMRRLNVALSRAKKKLIIIGNLKTLCDESAHKKEDTNIGISPVKVFESLRNLQDRTADKTFLDKFRDAYENGEISVGTIFEDCNWSRNSKCEPEVEIELPTKEIVRFRLNMKDAKLNRYAKSDECIDVKFVGFDKGQAHFEYIPHISIADQIGDGLLCQFYGIPIEWQDDDYTIMKFRFDDESESCLKIQEFKYDCLFSRLLDSSQEFRLPLFYLNGEVKLDQNIFDDFASKHPEGNRVKIEVVDGSIDDRYLVRCRDVYGEIMKMRTYTLTEGCEYNAIIFKHGYCYVKFNLVRR